MSFRSGSNTDFTFNNLKVNGTLTLLNELEITDLDVQGDADVENLDVRGDANVVGNLKVTGDTNLNTLDVTGNTTLLDLNVIGDSILTNLSVNSDANVVGNTLLNTLSVNGVCDLNKKVNVDSLVVINDFDILCGINVNNVTVSPQELCYVHGVTSSIQGQLNTKADTSNPTFTGSVIMPTTYSKAFTYFGNDGSHLPTFNISQYGGAIGSNIAGGGNGEMDFINTGYMAGDMALSAFDWFMLTSSTTKDLLMRLYHSGKLMVTGLLDAAGGITTTTLTATGLSTLAAVSVNGNLTVTGSITSPSSSNMEILYYNLRGNAASVQETMTLAHNSSSKANYSVFPSIYYNFSGSGGTYDANQTSQALHSIVIGAQTASSFNWTINKATADNVNCYLVFLVIYSSASTTTYPSYYTS